MYPPESADGREVAAMNALTAICLALAVQRPELGRRTQGP